jgi:hypothetical protein
MSKFELIDGTVSELVVRQDEHDFVFNATDKTSGAVAATGLAIGGLAGAATGAVLSSSEIAEQVDYFLCKVGEHSVRGRFGKVTFVDGDIVQIAVQRENNNLQAYAVVRPCDQTVWMHPHCGRGSIAFYKYAFKSIFLLSTIAPACLFGMLDIFVSDNSVGVYAWLLMSLTSALLCGAILTFVASRFFQFAKLSDDIFASLKWNEPPNIDLPKRLRDASKSFTNEQQRQYHPYARWVFKY